MDIVDKLIVNGSDIWPLNTAGQTLLHVAAKNKNMKVLKRVLSLGLDINHQDQCGHTPLMDAVLNGTKEAIKILLDHGADTIIRDSRQKMAIDYAKNQEIKELLNKYSS